MVVLLTEASSTKREASDWRLDLPVANADFDSPIGIDVIELLSGSNEAPAGCGAAGGV